MSVTFKIAHAWYGHELLDSQHRDILEKHDLIKGLAKNNNFSESIRSALLDLRDVLIGHFFHEEYAIRLLHNSKYKHYVDQHIRTHDHILDTIDRACDIVGSDENRAISALLPDMVTTLLDRMMCDDNRLIEYLIDEKIQLRPSDVYPCE